MTIYSKIKQVGILIALLLSVILVSIDARAQSAVKNIVLVHGAFADGSGWEAVYQILKKDGYNVSVVGNPNTGLTDDVAATQRVLDRQDGTTLLVGHSYGGAIITEAGNHPKVAGLVYIAAFVPDANETLLSLLQASPPAPKSGILPPDASITHHKKSLQTSSEGFNFLRAVRDNYRTSLPGIWTGYIS
ncbi:alpha/beta fold hydrolase [Chitinophaga sp. CF418]|uniref:alpha/beta fold hydrolase n=1 Tax=Chitinophaga sp. CF418 TaxID=1855287 RepID=UPI00091E9909|nr:alpha/beta hydrolase [Chitinophaga sp. CF418]SHL96629.1 Alpha/beta hydrolase family protein [Chitinophaga sp. CF418]